MLYFGAASWCQKDADFLPLYLSQACPFEMLVLLRCLSFIIIRDSFDLFPSDGKIDLVF
ncbi:hypothetical protein SLEP1_g649 [Rubroshorea leprosula]|uniref:Uncharacterized protein n=1 Tax=Rubroshorea leprosula TaxID=152421 RepID=A0AAV5HB74_9ROSI|nr:hypothetical protein SLEP1_g649 [Rubroshorea leprosula]